MNGTASKAKGRRLQNEIVKKILEVFPELTERDVMSRAMGSKGEDIVLSEEAAKRFPFSIEAKYRENLQLWKAIEQAEDNRKDLTPVLVFRRNRSKTYCVLEFDDFLKLVRTDEEEGSRGDSK